MPEDPILTETASPETTAGKLVALLDYIEQVVRLDERVASRLADYRLPDGSTIAIRAGEIAGLPGVATDLDDGDPPAWLAVERLARGAPPPLPAGLAPWLEVSADPGVPPVVRPDTLATVTATERAALIASDEAAEEDFAPTPLRDEAPRFGDFDLRLRLADRAGLAAALDAWIAGTWAPWAAEETRRRRTVALYGQLYRLQQMLELGGGDSAVELVWGIGTVRWRREGRTVDRPLVECAVEVELAEDGCLTVRPTGAGPRIDLRPFAEMGCDDLSPLDALARREFTRADAQDGVSPFRPDSFEHLLRAAATHLASDGVYRGVSPTAGGDDPPDAGPVVTGDWVLYARPRSRHAVLDDVARFRAAALRGVPAGGLAERLVTPPSDVVAESWTPLGHRLGEEVPAPGDAGAAPDEVFFPKPFNDDQVAIVRRLATADGLVVQGPPGTGKTHTIANVICHALALGQRVLVVSRGEAALHVLRDLLPEKVRPLAIAILSSERQGLRQVEGAIREIQAVVEESRPEIRLSAIRRCEAEIVKVRARLDAVDGEIDAIAARQGVPLGPDAELPADLARRLAAERGTHAWFEDAPKLFAAEAGLTDDDMARLRVARAALGPLLDHRDADLPMPDTLPSPEDLAGWHDDKLRGERLAATGGPTLHLSPAAVSGAGRAVRLLEAFAAAAEALDPRLVATLVGGDASPWTGALRDCCGAWRDAEADGARLAPFAVDLPENLLEDAEARDAVARAGRGERLWPRLSLGHAASKALVAGVRLRGREPGREADDWRAVAEAVALAATRAALVARWRHLAADSGLLEEAGGPAGPARLLALAEDLDRALVDLGGHRLPAVAALARDPAGAGALAGQIEAAAAVARRVAVDGLLADTAARFPGDDRSAVLARQVLGQLVGRTDVAAERVAALWRSLLARIAEVRAQAPAFAALRALADRVAEAGAPRWAERLRADADPAALPAGWRRAWDAAAGAARLAGIDGRESLLALSREREALDRRARKLVVELVRERAFLQLERRLSPRVKSALVEYVRALGRIGKGTGKGAGRHRRVARDAMARCYDAVPCWIMPTWRVAEQFPAEMGVFDLVILDEASQSDVTELPALLRGRKVLAVGDDRQVSPTPPFVTQARIAQLRRHHLGALPYAALLEPGESLYDLMRAVFPDSRLMLKEHFRCVEPIIRFSMGFYPETLIPLRVPLAAERLDPPLVDILVPHGTRDGARKINRAEAEVIVDEVAALIAGPDGAGRSIGVLSLIGAEQAELVRVLLTERIGEEAMQRHRVLCANSAGFQGNERDVVFLSMVADRRRRASLTALPYEQRFNVAASRARDRLVLVRSVERDDLADTDLKARLIDHFAHPLPRAALHPRDLAARCESQFERDMLARLLALGHRVTPQVGAEGFRIDLVVEGPDGRRLAVECDGDSFHGPERWRDDMRRQRILERVGWRFWRCFASSFYGDPDATMGDLAAALEREGIVPASGEAGRAVEARVVEHRVVARPASGPAPGAGGEAIGVGDRVALLFPDRRRLTLRLTEAADDHAGGLLSIASPLGAAVARAEEGDEIEVAEADGAATRVLVEAVERAA